jgi:CRP-like cAMP-binding protein
MAKQDAYLERLGGMPVFAACTKKELRLIGAQAEDVTFAPGKTLVKEGELGSELFLIVDGKASVSVKGRKVADLGPGDHFGELALLDPSPRDATVTAATSLEALVVGRREFASLLSGSPTLARNLLIAMARRLRDADRQLNA